ncbi:uncharacterized protein LOC111519142 [Drosophila willistoni]|uniref:uncharacterized protein LOC111519142 n=1 Tax=Drosophila willistoni TaxID=7260 RepID=UPI000C26C47D|nr:uncharacterized protein LOC111519142 [Drosophila willistoni]
MASPEVEETVEMEPKVQHLELFNIEPDGEEPKDSGYKWQNLKFEKKIFFEKLGEDIQVPSDIVKAYPHICLFSLYHSVQAQGGFDRKVDWDVVAICCSLLGFPPEELKSLYASLLLPFERVEARKTRELKSLGIPIWWDCGEYISPSNRGVRFRSYPFSKRTVAAVMLRVYQEYYITSPSRHDFRVKDSWIYICGYKPDRFIKIIQNFK